MFESLKESLKIWNASSDERIKLQHAYFIIFVALLVVAGLIGLVNTDTGRSVLVLAIFTGMVFVINAIAWALLQSFVVNRLSEPREANQEAERAAATVTTKKPKKRTVKK